MSWFKLTDEERREWRDHPSTVAYFDAIRGQIVEAKDEVVTALIAEDDEAVNRARRFAGRVDGFEVAIRVMENDK